MDVFKILFYTLLGIVLFLMFGAFTKLIYQVVFGVEFAKSSQSRYDRGLEQGKIDCNQKIMGAMFLPDAKIRGSDILDNLDFRNGYVLGYSSCENPKTTITELSRFNNIPWLLNPNAR